MSDLNELLRLLPDAPVIAKSLADLARGDPASLDAYLIPVERDLSINSTQTHLNCYFLAVDGNGRIRVGDFVQRVCDHLVDFAIPRSKIQEASEELARTGSSRRWMRLAREAKSLFTDLAKTGEGGELILFVLAEHIFGLPQIICKMSLKTSGHVHYHGADGVHASVDSADGTLCLHWGESKMYSDPSRAIADCMDSLAPYLKGQDIRTDRDLQLLRSFVDLNDPTIEAAIKAYLDPDNPAFNKLKYCGLAFIGFDSDCYPPASQSAIADEIEKVARKALSGWQTTLGNRIARSGIHRFDMRVVCLPFPSVQAFRDRFLQELGISDAG